jgi:5-dehydro-2-deoxygluconokinase
VSDPDLLTIGRVNLDLYAQQHGVPFADVSGWDAMVGGSPVNVAIAARRLGVRSGVLTAVGADLVGDWVLRALQREDVDTSYLARKRGPHTSLALRAQQPPDHPLAFYRHDPADIHLTLDDVAPAPVGQARVVLASADALARGSMAVACAAVVRRARRAGVAVYVDLDLREVSWPDPRAYPVAAGTLLEHADVVVGTEAEFAALLGHDTGEDLVDAVRERVVADGRRVAIVKHGERGLTLLAAGEVVPVAPVPVAEASTVGAGDSFAAGLIAARLDGLGWTDAARFGAACAAVTVSRYGCSAGFPRRDEVAALLDDGALAAHARS